ncbi:competence/damage-inducible protein A [Methanocella sp. CWC-04]|uniref:Competence/damage-inducible protein A n=1 Tax=Methanooceanicella nereidis TaxID=2052831 RepID=A0AAP2RDP8_9EURY|nr:molybdopterin-binding protein [Methanocella sp. CWC-04]MCD1295729.1 competence/damage-inducible protein A [Methanocella sp. CWC-04]
MDATVICIGDELLSGDISDMNSVWLAKRLTDNGVAVKKIIVIPDDIETIADEIKRAATDKVIITGGIGPTHDDITRYGVAKAAGVGLVRDPEAVKIVTRVTCKPDALTMADIPAGSGVIPNPVGAAPGFIVEGRIFVFPGVPSEMKAMFEHVMDMFTGKKMFVDWLISKRPESDLVSGLNEAVKKFPDVLFGSYPSGVVKIKMRSYDAEQLRSAKKWLEDRIRE